MILFVVSQLEFVLCVPVFSLPGALDLYSAGNIPSFAPTVLSTITGPLAVRGRDTRGNFDHTANDWVLWPVMIFFGGFYQERCHRFGVPAARGQCVRYGIFLFSEN